MKELKFIGEISEGGYSRAEPEIRWRKRKDRPNDRILFATDGRGAVHVIDHIGPGVEYVMAESREWAIDVLRTWAFPGIWVFDCWLNVHRDYWGEQDEDLDGVFRPMDEDERRAVIEDDHVWDRTRWVEP